MNPQTRAPAPRQLVMDLDSLPLRGLAPAERIELVALLAGLLLEASGMVEREDGDESV